MKRLLALPMLAATLVAGCAPMQSAGPSGITQPAAESSGWRSIATGADRNRVRNWRSAWVSALEAAQRAGHGGEIAAGGALFAPDAAQPNPYIPPGEYRCRTIKLGAQQPGMLDYIAYGWFACRIAAEQEIFSLTKLTGSQRPIGLLFDDSDRRQVFLGTLQLGDEKGIIDYGVDPDRDMAGVLERIGPGHWRLALPYPAYESLLDVIEIVPVE